MYDPATNAWQRLPAAPVDLGIKPMPALLPNGHVRFAGGSVFGFFGDSPANTAAELDPVTRTWTVHPAPALVTTYDQQTLATLAGGKVLLGEGLPDGSDADYLYDPATATWSVIAGSTRGGLRSTLTALSDGRALAVGARAPVRL